MSGALLASQAGVKIIPVAHNAGDYWPRRGLLKKPGTIRVVIGPPIEATGRDPRELNAEVQAWIEGTMRRISAAAPDPPAQWNSRAGVLDDLGRRLVHRRVQRPSQGAAADPALGLDMGEFLVAVVELREHVERAFSLVAESAPEPALELAALLKLHDPDADLETRFVPEVARLFGRPVEPFLHLLGQAAAEFGGHGDAVFAVTTVADANVRRSDGGSIDAASGRRRSRRGTEPNSANSSLRCASGAYSWRCPLVAGAIGHPRQAKTSTWQRAGIGGVSGCVCTSDN